MGDSSFEHRDMHRKKIADFFISFLFIFHIATFMSPKDHHTFYYFFAEIKDPISGECPSTKIAALDI